MLTALTRGVSPTIDACELNFLPRQPINVQKAIEQQQNYEKFMREKDVNVVSLAVQPDLPDAVFVEDTAVIVDEVAVIVTTGAVTRRREVETVAEALARHYPLEFVRWPGTLEGGDVIRVGRTLFVGASRRTNRDGIAQLREILRPYDYQVVTVGVHRCLHLTTACSYLGHQTMLVNRDWVDCEPLKGFELIDILPTEQWAANTLKLNGINLVSSSFPRTSELLEARGFQIYAIELSELEKAEAGPSCLSLIFETRE
jgi:dimethylargininase